MNVTYRDTERPNTHIDSVTRCVEEITEYEEASEAENIVYMSI